MFLSPKLSRKYYEEKAQVITTKDRMVSNDVFKSPIWLSYTIYDQSPYEMDQNPYQSNQIYAVHPDLTATYLNTPYKIDRTLINYNYNYRNYANEPMHFGVTPRYYLIS